MRGRLTPPAYEDEVSLVRKTLSTLDGAHWQEYLAAWPEAGSR